MDNNIHMTSFWSFLRNNTVEIPIVQRDYAQGRADKVDLRARFLDNLKGALDNTNRGGKLVLDFVYGAKEADCLEPLDGQQRLTTLWLLHWYIALRANRLEEAAPTLKKFTYETRLSSREFCKEICESSHFDDWKLENRSVVDFITNQTWFFFAWKQDPTVKAMLTMLKGTVEVNNDVSVRDGIEPAFSDVNSDKFIRYWELLKSDACPIVFYSMPLKDFGLSDDLYIKMNARGKQLSAFENFKADLTKHIRDRKWDKLLNDKDGIPKKLDTDWTDVFWNWKKSTDGKIDGIYLAFLNRFFLNQYIVKHKGMSYEKIEKSFVFKSLMAKECLSYTSFKAYEWIDEHDLNRLASILDNFSRFIENRPLNSVIASFLPKWDEKDSFRFVPEDDEFGKPSSWTRKQGVVFHAICKFFEYKEFDETQLSRWMRVVWNLVENAGREDSFAMIPNLHFIDELSSHSHDIYEWLSSSEFNMELDANTAQLDEERAKARKILESKEWENKIQEAEKYAFFKGAIRFLFQDGGGKETEGSWNDFDIKWRNAQKYFDGEGVVDSDKKYKSNSILLKALVSRCSDDSFWQSLWWDKHIFNNISENWRSLLLSCSWISQTHDILLGHVEIKKNSIEESSIKTLVDSVCNDKGVLSFISNERQFAWIRRTCRGFFAFWESGYPKYMIPMIPVLNELASNTAIKYRDICHIEDSCFATCADGSDYGIDFTYRKHNFRFYMYPSNTIADVYLLDEDWEYVPTGVKSKDDHKAYYCFDYTENMTKDNFIHQLDKLLSRKAEQK